MEFEDNQQQLHSQKSVGTVTRAKSRISMKQASEMNATSPTPDNSKEANANDMPQALQVPQVRQVVEQSTRRKSRKKIQNVPDTDEDEEAGEMSKGSLEALPQPTEDLGTFVP